ncbi:MAG: hypothetical protein MUC59_07050 [Saprospiraceae bacterium]|jgi:hypothetical protein|nr:hypothetical protein [Saprospiraceae bacterium]
MTTYGKKPRNKTIVAFLKSKGWQLEKTGEVYFHMKPPNDMVFDDKDFQYLVPVNEDAQGYEEFVFGIVRSISQLYEFELGELFDLLSKSMEEIRREVERETRLFEMRQELIAYIRKLDAKQTTFAE